MTVLAQIMIFSLAGGGTAGGISETRGKITTRVEGFI
jgi:hypothetical protein